MSASKSCFLFLLCVASLAKALAQSTPPAFNLRVLETPQPTVIDGKSMVYYELLLDNLLNDSLELKTLEVIQTSDHSVVATFNRDDLSRRYGSLDGTHKGRKGVLNPDGSGIIYLEIALKQADAGVHLIHRLEVDALNQAAAKRSFSVEGGKIQHSKTSPVVLGTPLRGGPWVAIYEPSWERGHRRVMFTTDGEQHIPGRFAIDFIMPDQQGQFSKGNSDSTRNWYGYGVPVLAASDGVVVATRIDFMESLTLSAHPDYPASKATGNYIAIAINNNRVVFYEHLQPGSITVKSGQRVKKGDVIAAIGFTGQTTGPHLHLHVADRNSPLGAEGVPFAIDAFTLLGVYADPSGLGRQPWTPLENKKMVKEHPGPNTVIMFQP
ncbi:Peptidase family M23 [Chryseolinea serpens]|uniref:Peptidase family M23 n=1 Tax=Chryseolinea serpens TaxID=947013 RepID=A0A1M5JMR5_9BACT|nr:M23 family metallopeptidase [Chryseolinea serpens]SHG41876.1 Peptidase family M23 [Chryseolinea serpens]